MARSSPDVNISKPVCAGLNFKARSRRFFVIMIVVLDVQGTRGGEAVRRSRCDKFDRIGSRSSAEVQCAAQLLRRIPESDCFVPSRGKALHQVTTIGIWVYVDIGNTLATKEVIQVPGRVFKPIVLDIPIARRGGTALEAVPLRLSRLRPRKRENCGKKTASTPDNISDYGSHHTLPLYESLYFSRYYTPSP